MNKKEIKKELKNILDFDITEPNNIGISDVSIHLENKGLIDFSINYRETEEEVWLQCEYWCNKINHAIIVDYDFPDNFSNIDEFINALECVEERINVINSKIN